MKTFHINRFLDLVQALSYNGTAYVTLFSQGKHQSGILQAVQRESGDGQSFLVHILTDNSERKSVFWKAPKE